MAKDSPAGRKTVCRLRIPYSALRPSAAGFCNRGRAVCAGAWLLPDRYSGLLALVAKFVPRVRERRRAPPGAQCRGGCDASKPQPPLSHFSAPNCPLHYFQPMMPFNNSKGIGTVTLGSRSLHPPGADALAVRPPSLVSTLPESAAARN